MIRYKDMIIIAVDHGYGNIKTANTVTPTGIKEYDSEPTFKGNILEYDGKWYKVGERHKEFEADKTADDEYYLLTLMAIARELNQEKITEADVYLACGLPLKWFRSQREEFKAYLMRKKKVSYKFNGREYHIRFAGCTVLPQGYPAVAKEVGSYQETHMLADIGNGTMNVMYIIDKKPMEDRCWTEKLGANECMIAARNAVMDKTGVKIEDATIERVLRFGSADIPEKYLSIIKQTAEEYADEIFKALRKYEYTPELVRLHIVGGGASVIKNFGEYDPSRVEIIEDVCANAKGYEYITEVSLRRSR